MSDSFVPIDISSAKEMIPPGEDIVYSTLCFVKSIKATYDKSWTSHVLMTTKGLVYTTPLERNKPPYLTYLPWNSIKGFIGKRFQRGSMYFRLIREENFETKQGFKQRCKEFKSKIKPIQQAGKEYWLTNFPTKKERKAELNRIVELYKSEQNI